MSTPLKRYAFINAKLKTRLGKRLSEDFFTRLIHAPTLNEAVQLLHDTPFKRVETVYAATGDLKMGELELFAYEIGLYQELQKFLHDELKGFLKALQMRYEIENLKDTLRLWLDRTFRQRDISAALGYLYRQQIIHPIEWDRLLNAPDIDSLARLLEGTPYASLIAERSEVIASSASLFSLEIDLDLYFYRELHEKARSLDKGDISIIERILGVEIDLENLSRIIRFREFYSLSPERILSSVIPGGYRIDRNLIAASTRSTSEGELLPVLIAASYPGYAGLLRDSGSETGSRLMLLEELLLQILGQEVNRLLTGNPFTVGILLGYVFLKRREVSRLSTILNAKYYGLNEEQIRRRL